MFGIGTKELIIIGIILLFLFGAKRIPQLFKSIADAVRQLKEINKEKK
ncbi:MAG TPA: twin-arginine translocase TatA/TatE family subunit [Candidatus Magasanikbacteria bacterium]|nr:twin-arginine translocase TatA/TatE family subunit [Candidatus Magasanikbacteria bacterium]